MHADIVRVIYHSLGISRVVPLKKKLSVFPKKVGKENTFE
jgi:hypothetical protein